MNRVAVQWALFLALAVVAVAYFVMPVQSEEACGRWKAELHDQEGGAVLTAFNCAREVPEAYLSLTCHEGKVWLRYDLAYGGERSPDLDEAREVVFMSGDGSASAVLIHEAMDGLFASEEPVNGAVLALLRSGQLLEIGDMGGFYPYRIYSLAGSAQAIDTLIEAC